MHIEPFFDPDTYTLTYVVLDPTSKDAIIIDPVLDFDPIGSKTSTASAERILAYVQDHGLRVHLVLETHAHADHLTAARWLARRLDARVGIGERIRAVQATFQGLLDLGPDFAADGSQFDLLLADDQVVEAGTLRVGVLATPGHTPACVTYQVGDAIFTGDALFTEDYGTGRCDFPAGSADALYDSIQRLYKLPDATRVFVGHDYQPGGREVRWQTTIGASKERNPQLRASTARADFVKLRTTRDQSLAAPRLLWPSIQVNVAGGRLPAAHANGVRYLRVPINLRPATDDDGTPR
ncbi:MAG: MBL fold metallo-hydrolase [Kofleriaceae bacterium]|nr:MBL fold metallo-hydrolase [Myxococcales bacterium]MCB9563019.1 MBL fold metallo-hydrolase [Kofleriaceae bacterium]